MSAKTVVRVDALFEAALGAALVGAGAAGALGADDFPHPVGRVVIVLAGVVLVGLGAILWLGVVGPASLAVGNTITAVAAVVWLLAASGFSGAGVALVAATAAGLALLAAGQAAALRA